jgi:uncharacterized protein
VGSWELRTPSATFEAVVPWLILAATLLLAAQEPLSARLRQREAIRLGLRWKVLAVVFQAGVGVYGGYFGAGIGILMLAVLGAMGLTNIHRMNGLKNWGALCINAVAALVFSLSGVVNWPFAVVMAVGGLVGGYSGAWLAQRVAQVWVRRAISAIGLSAFLWLFLKQ